MSGKRTRSPRRSIGRKASGARRNGKTNPADLAGLLALPVELRLNPTANPQAWRAAGGKPTCQGCVAHCCRYISVEIDTPNTKWQYDQILWMLLHENVSIYVEEGEWFVEFQSRCRALNESNLCSIYPDRPKVCRDYSNETCSVWSESDPKDLRFDSAQAFAEYLDGKKVNWRFKHRGGFDHTAQRGTLRRSGRSRVDAATSSRRSRTRNPAPSA